ncbi:hypothetical protein SARC_06248 [Sphaeroforma arctica JP610]|uniref:Uncharacterized protein n=1 Tax=Sphaeroforma arctica JP610 TaxID=667725 RepID=A0A0L0FX69_9EUKA|nr:hypothetical protein SARC_06248 [Sphaeroforma arctica JP610]KNC81432.1 hypothetical protein SARC_06248 [Sphaeroforma arctica JP610]|eukprot:XP_014155334.1 hypothetical protein SARC_06248 [Sphaeroforma arctica JP610]
MTATAPPDYPESPEKAIMPPARPPSKPASTGPPQGAMNNSPMVLPNPVSYARTDSLSQQDSTQQMMVMMQMQNQQNMQQMMQLQQQHSSQMLALQQPKPDYAQQRISYTQPGTMHTQPTTITSQPTTTIVNSNSQAPTGNGLQPRNDCLHCLLCCCTGGLWCPFWAKSKKQASAFKFSVFTDFNF